MKLYSILLFVTVANAHYISNQINCVSPNCFLCQQWCYKYDNYGSIFLTCCHMKERHGYCPKGCIFGYGANIRQLLCQTDQQCPMGYKCCPDKCLYFQKICKPIMYPVVCEAPPTPFPPVTQPPTTCPTEPHTITTKQTESPTTESNSEELPTLAYDGSGGDSWEIIDDEFSGDDEWEFVTTIRDDVETHFTTVGDESTIYDGDNESTAPAEEGITIPMRTTPKASGEEEIFTTVKLDEEEMETTHEVNKETTINYETTEEEMETTIREDEEVETTIKPEVETTTLGEINGSGSGSGSGDGDDEDDESILLPPAAFRSNSDDDFYYEQL